MRIALLLALLFLLIPRTVIASSQERIHLFESRLENVVKALDRVDSPIQQMGPQAGIALDSAVEDLQTSIDEVTERLQMAKFIVENNAPAEKMELATDELKFMSSDISEIEGQTLALSKKVDLLIRY